MDNKQYWQDAHQRNQDEKDRLSKNCIVCGMLIV
jgi:hypothetical protein